MSIARRTMQELSTMFLVMVSNTKAFASVALSYVTLIKNHRVYKHLASTHIHLID